MFTGITFFGWPYLLTFASCMGVFAILLVPVFERSSLLGGVALLISCVPAAYVAALLKSLINARRIEIAAYRAELLVQLIEGRCLIRVEPVVGYPGEFSGYATQQIDWQSESRYFLRSKQPNVRQVGEIIERGILSDSNSLDVTRITRYKQKLMDAARLLGGTREPH